MSNLYNELDDGNYGRLSKTEDLSGRIFTRWEVIKRVEDYASGTQKWLCRCTCELGTIKKVSGQNLKKGKSKSCGCLKKELEIQYRDLTGLYFGKWNVLRFSRKTGGNTRWICQCECGSKPKEVLGFHLVDGRSTSCGCLVESVLATELKYYLWKKYNAIGEFQIIFNPVTGSPLYYDIFLPLYNLFIEVHGGQHYSYSEYFHKTLERFESSKNRDLLKKNYAEKNGIYLEIDLRKTKETSEAIDTVEDLIWRITKNEFTKSV